MSQQPPEPDRPTDEPDSGTDAGSTASAAPRRPEQQEWAAADALLEGQPTELGE